ncbi:MAG: zinc-binding dehydrogenase, partial [Myxococcota bacterium]
INPSDLMFIRGLYGFKKTLPVTPGFEASGMVVATGGGIAARALLGRRVAYVVRGKGDGPWAQYVRATPTECVPLRSHVTDEQGSMIMINPLTAYAMVDAAQKEGHKALVQNAAAGALGRMMLRIAQRANLPMIHIVRRPAQVEQLRQMGAEHVLNSSNEEYPAALREACRALGATMALDAVGGEETQLLCHAMERGSTVVVYGGLALEPARIDVGELVFRSQTVRGFWLTNWIRDANVVDLVRAGNHVQMNISELFDAHVQQRYELGDFAEALEAYASSMSQGKVLFAPNG